MFLLQEYNGIIPQFLCDGVMADPVRSCAILRLDRLTSIATGDIFNSTDISHVLCGMSYCYSAILLCGARWSIYCWRRTLH